MMELEGKVALVTGASAGNGVEICKRLVGLGMKVVGCARRLDVMEKLAEELNKNGTGKMMALKCDLCEEEDILKVFSTIQHKYGRLDVLVNNAGVYLPESIIDGNTDAWKIMMNINVISPAICAREAFKLMREAGVEEGNIIFVNSTLGHRVINLNNFHFYTISKHAVTTMVECFRKETAPVAPHIRCTSLCPGATNNPEFFKPVSDDPAKVLEFLKNIEPLETSDVVDTLVFILQTSTRVSINEIIMESPIAVARLET